MLEHVRSLGLEGIVGKNIDQPYRSGRTGDWVKIKCVASEAFMVVGYEPSTVSPGGEFVHVGNAGTGFNEAEMTRLRKMLDTLRWKQKHPPVPYPEKSEIVWVEPTLIAEIEFRAWTADGKLRHASYMGLRERQDNADVFRIN